MKHAVWLRILLTACLTGLAGGCGDMARQSIKEGTFSFVTGSLTQGLLAAQLGNVVNSFLVGGWPGAK